MMRILVVHLLIRGAILPHARAVLRPLARKAARQRGGARHVPRPPGSRGAAPSHAPQEHNTSSWTKFPAGNCNCQKPLLAQYSSGFDTPALCGAKCRQTAGCFSFGIWTGRALGHCALFGAACTTPCTRPTAVSNGYTNIVYNMRGLNKSLLSGRKATTTQGWCSHLRAYVENLHLKRIFIGAAAKCAGTTLNTFFGQTWTSASRRTRKDHCDWIVTGFGIGKNRENHLVDLQELISSPCGLETLFLISVRDKMSWLRSATREICERRGWAKRGDCSSLASFRWIRERPHELGRSPADVVRKNIFISNTSARVAIFDYRQMESLLQCFPQGSTVATSGGMSVASIIWQPKNGTEGGSGAIIVSKNRAIHKVVNLKGNRVSQLEKISHSDLQELYDADGVGKQRWDSMERYFSMVLPWDSSSSLSSSSRCQLASWHGDKLDCIVL